MVAGNNTRIIHYAKTIIFRCISSRCICGYTDSCVDRQQSSWARFIPLTPYNFFFINLPSLQNPGMDCFSEKYY